MGSPDRHAPLFPAANQAGHAARLHPALEAMEDAYYEVDLSGNLLLFNSAFSRLIGYPVSEMPGLNNRQYQSAEAASHVYRIFHTVFQTGRPVARVQWEVLRKDGGQVIGEGSVHLMRDASGAPVGFRGIVRDVTQLRQVEQALRASEEKYRGIIDTAREAYFEVDLKGYLVLCNRAFLRMLGYEAHELIGQNYRAFQAPDVAEQVYRTFNQVFRTGVGADNFDWSLICKDGSTVLGEGSVQLVRGANGEAVGFCGFLRDVTERRKVEQSLRESEEKYRGILETIQDPYYEVDKLGNIVMCNDALCRMLGYQADELIGQNAKMLQMPEFTRVILDVFRTVYETGQASQRFEWPMVRKDKTIGWGEGSVQLVRKGDGEIVGFRGIVRDVTERRDMERALRESEARFRALTDLSSDWYWEQDSQFRYTRLDKRNGNAGGKHLAYIGKTPWDAGLLIEHAGGWQEHLLLLTRHESFRDVIMHRRLDDKTHFYLSVSGEPVFDSNGRFTGYRGVSREITDQKIAEERIHHLATHDALTGLPNRMMFGQLLAGAINEARINNGRCAVLFLDLDRFKYINDTLGHEAGDLLLTEVTARFHDALQGRHVIARLGGDEFVVLVEDMTQPEQPADVARALLAAAVEPVRLSGRDCRVSASIGIAIYPEDGENEQLLMKNADIAMYFAKEQGKNNFQFYSKDIRTQSVERLVMENYLRFALERGELSLHYQAKRNLANGKITGVEALLRWHHPELGPVSPMQFIPIAEETGLIIDIGKWVLKSACTQLMLWRRAGMPTLSVAVNLSVRQFGDDHLLDDVAAILEETGMPPELLELEITESMVIHNPSHARQLLGAIKKMGLRLAMDDFGTGYSSLAQLKHFPIDILKVDRSFIRDLATTPEDKAITEAIIAMGKTLSMTVVAEGVETMEQEAFLRAHACDEMQGYYFSKPLPPHEFAQLFDVHAASGKK